MALLSSIQFADADKLEILRQLDRHRRWRSLDEKRYCLACGLVIQGYDILIVGGTRGTGPLRVICPSRGCHSIPMDWVLPTEEVLAHASSLQNAPSGQGLSAADLGRVSFGTRLRKFASQFGRAA